MARYEDENGREIFTEYGGGDDPRMMPNGRRLPLTVNQEAQAMRRAMAQERIGLPSDYDQGRQVGRRTRRS